MLRQTCCAHRRGAEISMSTALRTAVPQKHFPMQWCAWLLMVAACGMAPAAGQTGAEPSTQATVESEIIAEEGSSEGDVIIDGQKFVTVYQAIGSYTVQERAARITERILAVAKDRKVS